MTVLADDTTQLPREGPRAAFSADFAQAFGQSLLARSAIDVNGLDRARRVADESGSRLDVVVAKLGLVGDRVIAEVLSDLLKLPMADPSQYPDAPVAPERFKPKFLHKARLLPLFIDDQSIGVAVADPLDDFAPRAVGAAVGLPVKIWIAIPADLERAFERLYRSGSEQAIADAIEGSASAHEGGQDDAERLKDLASEAPVIRLVNQLISQAVETRASDIHVEPFEDRLRIRYRYDGVLHEVEAPPRSLQTAIISRIKIMAKLDIAERRLPQDGRIKLAVRGLDVDLRVSTIPSLHGETVVLRILDRSAVVFDFDTLGIAKHDQIGLRQALEAPNGILLVTGPTGSGKTTTLYSSVLHLNAVSRKIVTVEDPVEYQLAGINQIHVKPQIGLTFASLLRSILRQDPDVIMIGEIRDIETAQIAVQAALTGHLVLSTLHTNSAAATIVRLRDMGVDDYLITATLNAVMAQRLIRRLCDHCKRPADGSAELLARFDLGRFSTHSGAPPSVLFEAAGCPACRGSGYSGRMAVSELLVPNATVKQLVLDRADQTAIAQAAAADGMSSMYDSGLQRVAEGSTTLEEVLRTIRLEI
jgi:general secretion pathway protein E